MRCKQRTKAPLPLEGWEAVVQAKLNGLPPDAMADVVAGRAKLIPLTQGKFAVVDADVCPQISKHLWYLLINRYAARNGSKGMILMHRVINATPYGLETDHANGNGLDNRRINLRNATRNENQHNRKISINNTTGFKGVYFMKRIRKFAAAFRLNNQHFYLGVFTTAEEAHQAYSKAVIKLHGHFARVN